MTFNTDNHGYWMAANCWYCYCIVRLNLLFTVIRLWSKSQTVFLDYWAQRHSSLARPDHNPRETTPHCKPSIHPVFMSEVWPHPSNTQFKGRATVPGLRGLHFRWDRKISCLLNSRRTIYDIVYVLYRIWAQTNDQSTASDFNYAHLIVTAHAHSRLL